MNRSLVGAIVAEAEELARDSSVATGASASLPAAVFGKVAAVRGAGDVDVEFPGSPNGEAVSARSLVALEPGHVGASVALMFENGCAGRPIVVGLLIPPGASAEIPGQSTNKTEVHVDGERIVLSGEREISLRCGSASITLTRAGKVLIQGAYLLSRSSGTHRIKGASVQIN